MTRPIPPNPARVSSELAARYTTRGPRYTSYPTAPHFSPEVNREALFARWRASNEGPHPAALSLYVHIPFCFRRCLFCGCFTTIASHPEAADPYLDDVIRELHLMARLIDPARPVQQLALGGGSPNFLTPDRFRRLMHELGEIWNLAPDAERSIEIDPRRVDDAQLDAWFEAGFNRFSMGVQDLDESVQAHLHRTQPLELTQALADKLRARGTHAINFDLIYGLPGQTHASFTRTMERVLLLAPSRLALYNYAHVPWMQRHQKALERFPMPTAEEKLALFAQAYDTLTAGGYVPIGMDHFAKPDDELVAALDAHTLHRNFMGYTTRRGLDQLAFGVSGISNLARTYHQNVKPFAEYHATLADGRPATERGYVLSDEDAIRRDLIMDLFCNFHLDTKAFGARWGIDFAAHFASELDALAPFVRDGLARLSADAITLTPLGHAFVRNVCMVFDAHLEREPAARHYSQTV